MSKLRLKFSKFKWGNVLGNDIVDSVKVVFPTSGDNNVLYGWIEERESNRTIKKIVIETPQDGQEELKTFIESFLKNCFQLSTLKLGGFIEFKSVEDADIRGHSWTVAAVIAIIAGILDVEEKVFYISGAVSSNCGLTDIRDCNNKCKIEKINLAKRIARQRELIITFFNCENPVTASQHRSPVFSSPLSDCDILNCRDCSCFIDYLESKFGTLEKLADFFDPFKRWKEEASVDLTPVVSGVESLNVDFVELEVLEERKTEVSLEKKEKRGENLKSRNIEELNIISRPIEVGEFLRFVKKELKKKNGDGFTVPVYGPGGSGKTFLLKWLHNSLLDEYKGALPVYVEAKDLDISWKIRKVNYYVKDYFKEVPPLLIILDGLDEASETLEKLQERIKQQLNTEFKIKGWVYSTREDVIRSGGQNGIVGFRTGAIKEERVRNFIETYVGALLSSSSEQERESKVNEICNCYKNLISSSDGFSEVLRIPFYLAIFVYLSLQNKIENVQDSHHLVVRFIGKLLEENFGKIENRTDIKKSDYIISNLAVLSLMAFLMLRLKLYRKEKDYLIASGIKNVDLSLDFSKDGENIGGVEVLYGDSAVTPWDFNNDLKAAFGLFEILCERRKITGGELDIYQLSLLLICDLLRLSNHKLLSLLGNVLSREALERSGILTVNQMSNGKYRFSFIHRIIHENLISAFIAIVAAYLKDKKEFEFNSKKFSWKNPVKLIGMLEDTGIPGHISPFDYLSVSVLWMKEIANLETEEKVYEFAYNLLTILDEVRAENDEFFNIIRDSVIFNYLEI